MLFGYPVEATKNNWLHDCVLLMIKNINHSINIGRRFRWPLAIPIRYRSILKSRTGLRDRLKKYYMAARTLRRSKRNLILKAIESQNQIHQLLQHHRPIIKLEQIPVVVRAPLIEIFSFSFELLTGLGIRDEHYEKIYNNSEHVCPFCGTEYFDSPKARREALDHYLAKSKYPFAAANLRNLVPIGNKCNSGYKLATDILHNADGSRRIAFDPYMHEGVRLVLERSNPFGGSTENTPDWCIDFEPNTPEIATWNEVFSIIVRYKRDHLDPCYRGWLQTFAIAYQKHYGRIRSDENIVATLQYLEEICMGIQDRCFMKAAVYRMLKNHCQRDQRLLDQLGDLTTMNTRAIR